MPSAFDRMAHASALGVAERSADSTFLQDSLSALGEYYTTLSSPTQDAVESREDDESEKLVPEHKSWSFEKFGGDTLRAPDVLTDRNDDQVVRDSADSEHGQLFAAASLLKSMQQQETKKKEEALWFYKERCERLEGHLAELAIRTGESRKHVFAQFSQERSVYERRIADLQAALEQQSAEAQAKANETAKIRRSGKDVERPSTPVESSGSGTSCSVTNHRCEKPLGADAPTSEEARPGNRSALVNEASSASASRESLAIGEKSRARTSADYSPICSESTTKMARIDVACSVHDDLGDPSTSASKRAILSSPPPEKRRPSGSDLQTSSSPPESETPDKTHEGGHLQSSSAAQQFTTVPSPPAAPTLLEKSFLLHRERIRRARLLAEGNSNRASTRTLAPKKAAGAPYAAPGKPLDGSSPGETLKRSPSCSSPLGGDGGGFASMRVPVVVDVRKRERTQHTQTETTAESACGVRGHSGARAAVNPRAAKAKAKTTASLGKGKGRSASRTPSSTSAQDKRFKPPVRGPSNRGTGAGTENKKGKNTMHPIVNPSFTMQRQASIKKLGQLPDNVPTRKGGKKLPHRHQPVDDAKKKGDSVVFYDDLSTDIPDAVSRINKVDAFDPANRGTKRGNSNGKGDIAKSRLRASIPLQNISSPDETPLAPLPSLTHTETRLRSKLTLVSRIIELEDAVGPKNTVCSPHPSGVWQHHRGSKEPLGPSPGEASPCPKKSNWNQQDCRKALDSRNNDRLTDTSTKSTTASTGGDVGTEERFLPGSAGANHGGSAFHSSPRPLCTSTPAIVPPLRSQGEPLVGFNQSPRSGPALNEIRFDRATLHSVMERQLLPPAQSMAGHFGEASASRATFRGEQLVKSAVELDHRMVDGATSSFYAGRSYEHEVQDWPRWQGGSTWPGSSDDAWYQRQCAPPVPRTQCSLPTRPQMLVQHGQFSEKLTWRIPNATAVIRDHPKGSSLFSPTFLYEQSRGCRWRIEFDFFPNSTMTDFTPRLAAGAVGTSTKHVADPVKVMQEFPPPLSTTDSPTTSCFIQSWYEDEEAPSASVARSTTDHAKSTATTVASQHNPAVPPSLKEEPHAAAGTGTTLSEKAAGVSVIPTTDGHLEVEAGDPASNSMSVLIAQFRKRNYDMLRHAEEQFSQAGGPAGYDEPLRAPFPTSKISPQKSSYLASASGRESSSPRFLNCALRMRVLSADREVDTPALQQQQSLAIVHLGALKSDPCEINGRAGFESLFFFDRRGQLGGDDCLDVAVSIFLDKDR
ncbi:unnamed protein product [Amoebophrya sp. A25]|nr:unnamed protein product [Amoebophrya sp. A25]|eukprot:GSA25T00022597001.1